MNQAQELRHTPLDSALPRDADGRIDAWKLYYKAFKSLFPRAEASEPVSPAALSVMVEEIARSLQSETPYRLPVERALQSVFGSWHGCAMGTRKNPLHDEDRARGITEGQLCDDCNSQIAAHMKDIFK